MIKSEFVCDVGRETVTVETKNEGDTWITLPRGWTSVEISGDVRFIGSEIEFGQVCPEHAKPVIQAMRQARAAAITEIRKSR